MQGIAICLTTRYHLIQHIAPLNQIFHGDVHTINLDFLDWRSPVRIHNHSCSVAGYPRRFIQRLPQSPDRARHSHGYTPPM